MQIKSIMRHHYTHVRMAKLFILTIPSVDEDVEGSELSYGAGGDVKWHGFAKHLVSFLKHYTCT